MAALLAVFPLLLFVGFVAILIVIGLAVMAFGDREVGAILALIAGSMGLGASLAGLYGDGIQIVSERPCEVERRHAYHSSGAGRGLGAGIAWVRPRAAHGHAARGA
ncbi:MAG: hypothetical protein ACRDGV_01690 [Candidatus Limnocylindria bacterium]